MCLESKNFFENLNLMIFINMKMLIDLDELKNKKSREIIPLECLVCGKTHHRTKNLVLRVLNGNLKNTNKGSYCSQLCNKKHKNNSIKLNCDYCGKSIEKLPSEIKHCKNHFCGQSCSAIFNNTNKSFGIRRSKLEVYLEECLRSLYPKLEIHFNRKDTINSELDIYVPSLKLAFELNGIFHYEPIFGEEKLKNIKNNDNRKFQACLEKQIELCIIDVSRQKYFKKKQSEEYLNIIISLINAKVADK
jgi:hypothetical protein